MITIRWVSRGGLELWPTWTVEQVLIHTIENTVNGHRKLRTYLSIKTTPEQLEKLQKDYGRWNIPTCILGISAIELEPGAVLWEWRPPRGYEKSMPAQQYVGFEVEAKDE